ncbi:MAG: hypothetical protein WC761_00155 [Candidatus Paceibacterota bacterium]|jgi:hypothetical protein
MEILTYLFVALGIHCGVFLLILLFSVEFERIKEKRQLGKADRIKFYNRKLIESIYVPGQLYHVSYRTCWTDPVSSDYPGDVEVLADTTVLMLDLKITENPDRPRFLILEIKGLIDEKVLTMEENLSVSNWCDLYERDYGEDHEHLKGKRSRYWFERTRPLLRMGVKRWLGLRPEAAAY